MDHRLVVVAIQEQNMRLMYTQLNIIFGDLITIQGITLKELNYNSISSCDTVLLSAEEIRPLVDPFLPESCTLHIAERTVNIANLKKLIDIKTEKNILVVNDNYKSTTQTIDALNHVLPDHTYHPYTIQQQLPTNIDFLITPGEVDIIPSELDPFPIMDIGSRIIGFKTLKTIKAHFQFDMLDTLLNQFYMKTMVYLTEEHSNISPVALHNQNQHRTFAELSTKSEAMQSTFDASYQLIQTSHPIHIEGKPGTGKQMLAEMIQNTIFSSPMSFYVYSCSEKDPQMIEKELFGNGNNEEGIVNLITSGTLYIKNIEQLPYSLQGKLFHFINRSRKCIQRNKIQIITASMDCLKTLFQKGIIQTDMYTYLSPHVLRMPSLAERKEDIPNLIDAFKKHFNKSNLIFSENTMNVFYYYNWPGNVRELFNVISYCVCLEETYIEPELLPLFFKGVQRRLLNQTTESNELKPDFIINVIEKHGFLSESLDLLDIFKDGKYRNESYGRGRVKKLLTEKGLSLSEEQLKLRIKVLSDLQLLNVRIGRAGTTISEKGELFLGMHKQNT